MPPPTFLGCGLLVWDTLSSEHDDPSHRRGHRSPMRWTTWPGMHDAGPARVNGRHRRADIFTEGQGDQCAWYASVPDRHPRDPPEPAPLGSPSPRSAGSRAPAGVAGERPLPRRAH